MRSAGLDALRGVAILAMTVDHLALFLDVPELRVTVGRVAMPLFFVLGGHLARRLSWRLLLVPVVGLALEVVAPWSGAGSLLVTFAAGAVFVVLARRHPPILAVVAAAGIALGANGYAELLGSAYDPRCLVALMALGALLDRRILEGLRWTPAPLVLLGRFPLTFYAGHVLLLTLLWPS